MQDKSEIENNEYTFEELIDDVVDILGDLTAIEETEDEYIARFKFFTPYEDFVDFSYTLVSPIIETFILAVQTVLVGIIAALMPVFCLTCLVVAGVAALCDDDEFAIDCLSLAITSFFAIFSLLGSTIALAIKTAVEPIARTASIITRTGASVADACIGEDEEVNAEKAQMGI